MSGPNAATDLGLGGVSLTTDVGAVANAISAVFKAADDLLLVLNSPQMLAARKLADEKALLDQMDSDLKEAQRTGDFTKVDKETSG